MRLVYLGTPTFAVPTLERIAEAGHEVLEVVTQPDRPRGRGNRLAASPVKEASLRLGLPVYQPERVRRPEAIEHLRALNAEAMVIVGYGQIIPQSILDLVPKGIINVHASLLPKYRGAAPIQWAIANGETRTGVTTMRIDAGLDTGDMLLKAETEVSPDETAIELGERLALMGADLLVETLSKLDGIAPQKQDDAQATYAPILKKEDGRIDWTKPAAEIHNRVRGLQPWPGAFTAFRGQTMHLWRSRLAGDKIAGPTREGATKAGRVERVRPFLIECGEELLEVIEVQLEGRKKMSAADFVNGQRIAENEFLGESRA